MSNGGLLKMVYGVVGTLLTAAILAGASGLVTAQKTKADVDALKSEIKTQRKAIEGIQTSVTAIETTIKERAKAEEREQQRLDKDLDEIKKLLRDK